MKRISFNEREAEELYEWGLSVEDCMGERFKCPDCANIKKKLAKFIGKSSAGLLQIALKKHPYHKK